MDLSEITPQVSYHKGMVEINWGCYGSFRLGIRDKKGENEGFLVNGQFNSNVREVIEKKMYNAGHCLMTSLNLLLNIYFKTFMKYLNGNDGFELHWKLN